VTGAAALARRLAALGLAAMLAMPGAASAQSVTVAIGKISSERSCTTYQMSSGSSAMVVTPRLIAARASWRTWLVRDCVNNFATFRTTLEAALASSGTLAVGPRGRYSVTVSLSELGSASDSASNADSSSNSGDVVMSLDMTVRDAGGRIIYGGNITKHLETSSNYNSGSNASSSEQSGRTVYTQIQQQIAQAVARTVAFKLVPPAVTAVQGRKIQLNYGAPLVTLGMPVMVTTRGGEILRYRVSAAVPGHAMADAYGGGDFSGAAPGDAATVVEAEDPEANARRYERVDLP